MCYTTAALKKKQQQQDASSAAITAGTGTDNGRNNSISPSSHSNSVQSLPTRAVSPDSSKSSSSTSSSASAKLLLETSESSELSESSEPVVEIIEQMTTCCHQGGGGKRRFHAAATSNHDDASDAVVMNIDRGNDTSMTDKIHRQPSAKSTSSSSSSAPNYRTIVFLGSILLVLLLATVVLKFSLWFPFVLPHPIGIAALHTYEPAWYRYDAVHTKFDNTVWTYGTDYGLTIIMCYLAARCWNIVGSGGGGPRATSSSSSSSFRLRLYSSSLLLCYGLSTLAGGLAHQYFTSLELLNTRHFQWLWTICVGNVAFASGYMGLIGREVQAIFGAKAAKKNGLAAIRLGPWWFWPAFGTYMAGAVAMGYMSFKRPACDIFIAGITQFPTTFYCLVALGLPKSGVSSSGDTTFSPIGHVRLPYRIMYYVGFIGNAPLLPMYPLLVQYSGMSLAGINTLLHSWLMVMWGMQGISLLHLLNAIELHRPKVSRD